MKWGWVREMTHQTHNACISIVLEHVQYQPDHVSNPALSDIHIEYDWWSWVLCKDREWLRLCAVLSDRGTIYNSMTVCQHTHTGAVTDRHAHDRSSDMMSSRLEERRPNQTSIRPPTDQAFRPLHRVTLPVRDIRHGSSWNMENSSGILQKLSFYTGRLDSNAC